MVNFRLGELHGSYGYGNYQPGKQDSVEPQQDTGDSTYRRDRHNIAIADCEAGDESKIHGFADRPVFNIGNHDDASHDEPNQIGKYTFQLPERAVEMDVK